MANKKISDLTAATTLADADMFVIETAGGNSRKISKANASLAFGGKGLFSPVMSVLPTISNTGLSTAIGTNASVADSAAGVYISTTTANTGIAYKTAPASPYIITVCLAANLAESPYIGFSDGTKYQFMYASGSQILVNSNSALGTFVANNATISGQAFAGYVWLQIEDNGTTVYWRWSYNGVNWHTAYSVAKSSGYLGASGYTRVFVGGLSSAIRGVTILSYAQT